MKKSFFIVLLALACFGSIRTASAFTVLEGELAGPTDWLADVRLRNFNATFSDYEMMVNASPTRTVGQNQVNGQVPGNYAFAAWAEHNEFWITYTPGASASMSLRLKGWGARYWGGSDPRNYIDDGSTYDVTIGRAPDAVNDGPVNYINFQLWDRVNFPTFWHGVSISDLDGQNLGNFSIPNSGIGSWSICDNPNNRLLPNGFVLNGQFDIDLTKVAEGKEGDKLIWATGYNPNAEIPEIPEPGTLMLLSTGIVGLLGLHRKVRK